jgi:hypothetical protein
MCLKEGKSSNLNSRMKQGIGFLVRKAVVLAPIRFQISAYEHSDSPDSDSVLKIDCSQIIPGGLAGTTEKRKVDWTWQSHSDYIFGSVMHRSRMIGGTLRDGQEQLDFELQTELKDSRIKEFLLGGILPDGSSSDGFVVEPPNSNSSNEKGWWVHVFARNENPGWTAEQVNMDHSKTPIMAVTD